MKTLSRQDMVDMLKGCEILGTGGGGDFATGLEYIDLALSNDKEIKLASMSELKDHWMTCMPYMLGSVSGNEDEEDENYKRLPKADEPSILIAFKRLQSYVGQNLTCMIPCELGGENTAVAAYLAAMTDGILIDADVAGRAVPEITHSTYYLEGLEASPLVISNEFGECIICENIFDDPRAEQIARSFSIVSKNSIAVVDHPIEVRKMKHAVIEGTLSKALELGQILRKAQSRNEDVAQKVAEAGSGFVTFRGTIEKSECKTKGGYTIGEIQATGTGEYEGDSYKIDIKNENLLSWKNGEIDVTIPDLICVFDTDKNEPVSNPHHHKGMNIGVVILPAPKAFTTEKGLSAFGPEYLGLNQPYKPACSKEN